MGIPPDTLSLDTVDPHNTGWNNADNIIRGSEGAITNHDPSFTPRGYYPEPHAQIWEAVLHLYTGHMQNIAPLATTPPQIPLAPPSINRM